MLKQYELPACPVETALTLMGGRWKVLTRHLRIMEENGLVHRKVYAEVPPRVEYTLTDLGRSLQSIHDGMWRWGEEYKTICCMKSRRSGQN